MAEDLRARTRDWFERVWNGREESAIPSFAHEHIKCYGLDEHGNTWTGFDAFRRFRQAFLGAFPDLKIDVQDVLLDGNQTAARLSFTGTHQGDGLGIPPTGRPFVATAIIILRWNDGKIVEAWNEFDAAGMMRQLNAPAARLKGSSV